MREGLSFILALLAAICAENISLALGLMLAAVLAMASPQILDRLGIWAKREPPSVLRTPRAAKWKTPYKRFIHPYFKGFKGEMQDESEGRTRRHHLGLDR